MNHFIAHRRMFGGLKEVSSPALAEHHNRTLKHPTGKVTIPVPATPFIANNDTPPFPPTTQEDPRWVG